MKLIIGCLITVCLLILIPAVPAVEIHTVIDQNTSKIFQEIQKELQTINIKTLEQKIKDININELKNSFTKQSIIPGKNIITLFLLMVLFVVKVDESNHWGPNYPPGSPRWVLDSFLYTATLALIFFSNFTVFLAIFLLIILFAVLDNVSNRYGKLFWTIIQSL